MKIVKGLGTLIVLLVASTGSNMRSSEGGGNQRVPTAFCLQHRLYA